jgi:hypothetical protein
MDVILSRPQCATGVDSASNRNEPLTEMINRNISWGWGGVKVAGM